MDEGQAEVEVEAAAAQPGVPLTMVLRRVVGLSLTLNGGVQSKQETDASAAA